MQRTIKSTVITYAKNTIDEQGNVATEKCEYIAFNESKEKKAVKMAEKDLGVKIIPLKVEIMEKTYYLPDEIFFANAREVKE